MSGDSPHDPQSPARPGRRSRAIALAALLAALAAAALAFRYWPRARDSAGPPTPSGAASTQTLQAEIVSAETALRREPGNDELLLRLAELYLDAEQPESVISLLDARPSEHPGASLMRGLALLELGEPEAAEQHLLDAHQRLPDSPRAGVALYYLYDTSDRTDEAIRIAEETYKRHPDDYDTQIAQAEQLIKRGCDGDARQVLDEAMRAHPEWPEAYALMAKAGKTDPAMAASYAAKALERDPTCLLALLAQAESLAGRTGDPGAAAQAEAVLLKAAEAHPQHPGPPYQLGLLYRRAGRLQEAAQQLERAVELSPETVSSVSALAGVYADLGRRDEADKLYAEVRERTALTDAVSDLKRTILYEPRNVEPRLRLADLYLSHGHREAAVEVAKDVLKLDPKNQRALTITRAPG